ncbi:MAG: hypothetical protein NVS9B4_24140 [Candidatus Acidiferrum sp.]
MPSLENILDPSELLIRVDNDYELLAELLDIFKRDLLDHMQCLGMAVANADAASIARAGHTLKGMLLNMAAGRAAATAAQMEGMGRSGDISGAQAIFARLQKETKELTPELEKCLAQVHP